MEFVKDSIGNKFLTFMGYPGIYHVSDLFVLILVYRCLNDCIDEWNSSPDKWKIWVGYPRGYIDNTPAPAQYTLSYEANFVYYIF